MSIEDVVVRALWGHDEGFQNVCKMLLGDDVTPEAVADFLDGDLVEKDWSKFDQERKSKGGHKSKITGGDAVAGGAALGINGTMAINSGRQARKLSGQMNRAAKLEHVAGDASVKSHDYIDAHHRNLVSLHDPEGWSGIANEATDASLKAREEFGQAKQLRNYARGGVALHGALAAAGGGLLAAYGLGKFKQHQQHAGMTRVGKSIEQINEIVSAMISKGWVDDELNVLDQRAVPIMQAVIKAARETANPKKRPLLTSQTSAGLSAGSALGGVSALGSGVANLAEGHKASGIAHLATGTTSLAASAGFARHSVKAAKVEHETESEEKQRVKKALEGDFDVTWAGEISKVDSDARQVFGWASIVELNGEPVVDLQGDYMELADIEKAAYDYVVHSRVGGDMHSRVEKSAPLHVSDLIESVVVTPEKLEKWGLPANSLPTGWWVGYQVNDDATWNLVKSGERRGFSIHGVGKREPVELD